MLYVAKLGQTIMTKGEGKIIMYILLNTFLAN